MLAIDHLIYGCADLGAAAARIEASSGLTSVDGGRHVGRGTANRLIPLAGAYIELLAVVDEAEAAGAPLARLLAGPDRFVGWMVRTDDIDAVAAGNGLDVVPMARVRPDGVELSWRLAGLGDPFLPTFIQWDVAPEQHPAADGTAELVDVELRGDGRLLDEWLDGMPAGFPVTVGDDGGAPGIVAVTVRNGDRTARLS